MTNLPIKKNWLVLEFELSAEQEDLASWLLIHNGSTGCEAREANGGIILRASFPDDVEADERLDKLRPLMEEYGLGQCLKSLRVQTIADEDWLAKFKEGLKPFPIGSMFLVCPPWLYNDLTKEQVGDRHVLIIEPGMAFGTGLHATTQYCLCAMEHFAVPDDVLDVGTGSGILSIAAAQLNPAAKIVAVDISPESMRTASENIELNGVKGHIQLQEGSTEVLDNLTFDLILSNLTYEDIMALLVDYLRLLRPHGRIICSGILVEKLSLLEAAIASYPLKIVEQQVDGKWAGVTFQRIPVTLHA